MVRRARSSHIIEPDSRSLANGLEQAAEANSVNNCLNGQILTCRPAHPFIRHESIPQEYPMCSPAVCRPTGLEHRSGHRPLSSRLRRPRPWGLVLRSGHRPYKVPWKFSMVPCCLAVPFARASAVRSPPRRPAPREDDEP